MRCFPIVIVGAFFRRAFALPAADADADTFSAGNILNVPKTSQAHTTQTTALLLASSTPRHVTSSPAAAPIVTAALEIPSISPLNKDGVCVGTGPSTGPRRHSYTISSACPATHMFFYIANVCSGNRPHRATVGDRCHNINTGSAVQ